jgi:hypothetical protein
MTNKLLYHKSIAMKPIDRLEERVIKYIKLSGIWESASKSSTAFYVMPQLMNYMPELQYAFDGFRVLGAAAYIMFDHYPGGPHKDDSRITARINVPILNCDDTITEFWQLKPGSEPVIKTQINGLKYEDYAGCDLELVDQVCVNQPTILRIREIHSIRMLSELRPRITMTLRVTPDPVHLLEEHYVDTVN